MISDALGISIAQMFEEEKVKIETRASEPVKAYGKRKRVYDEIISSMNKLPDAVVNHYKMLLAAELSKQTEKATNFPKLF